jgi:hypothetical protein
VNPENFENLENPENLVIRSLRQTQDRRYQTNEGPGRFAL